MNKKQLIDFIKPQQFMMRGYMKDSDFIGDDDGNR